MEMTYAGASKGMIAGRNAAGAIAAALAVVTGLAATSPTARAEAAPPVTVDNFKRVESDLYFAKFVKDGAFGKFTHARTPVPVDKQDVIRMNRDTLYSDAVVDLEASDAVVTLPDAGGRFMGMQVINEDHYTPMVVYGPGPHTFTKASVGTRYVLFLVRTFVDPNSPEDLAKVHALQDALKITQANPGRFEVPAWDVAKAARIRQALNALAAENGGLDSARMFGKQGDVDPVQHLLGTAAGWGGNPRDDAYYAGVSPAQNDGTTVYRLTVGDVPVDGFWSISVYNREGFFEKNALDAYSINDVTAKRGRDGSVTVQFGGCSARSVNCLPITDGWNYLVRMYRPRASILDGSWRFPEAQPVTAAK